MQTGLHDYIPKQHRAEMKRMLIEEWDNQCAYCGYKQHNKELTIDHVVAIARGGDDEYTNLIPACRSCNTDKGDKPVRQWYFDHAEYSYQRWLKIKQHIEKEHVFIG